MASVISEAYGTAAAQESAPEKRLALSFILGGIAALLLGFLLGPPQALNYAGIDIYPYLPLSSYYQGLTLHGVLMALVFTSYFITGLLLYLPGRELGLRPHMGIAWTSFWLMTLGSLMAAGAMIANTSNVLYTLYPPLQGHPAFYLGLALVVVGTLLPIYLVWEMRSRWLRAHPGAPTPLVTYMSLVTWIMWGLASIGLVVGVVVLLLPWSFGWVAGVDPQLFRTLFWFTGHPIVYFWLLPAYVAWYGLLPRQAGGRLLSDPLARLVFLMFLLFSIPVGFHHQYADAGVPLAWKLVHNVTTAFVAIPSLITAFTVAASLENAGRARGGGGLFGWIAVLPWRDAAFTAPVLAMITFIFGGAGGIILSSFNLNLLVHNTAFIPGHFHVTVGSAVTMTFMGLAYLLIPQLTGKRLAAPRTALAAVWLWFIGMMLFALGMHWQGVLGVPRRTAIAQMAPHLADTYAHAQLPAVITGIAGVVLFLGGALFFYVIIATLLRRGNGETVPDLEFAEPIAGPVRADGSTGTAVRIMDRLGIWVLLTVLLVAAAYAPVLFGQVTNMQPVPGMQLW